MRCLPAVLGAACCAALPLTRHPNTSLETTSPRLLAGKIKLVTEDHGDGGQSFGEFAEVACGDGRTITLGEKMLMVSEWKLTGACTLLSGRIGTRGGTTSTLTIEGGTLHVQGVDFFGVRIVAVDSMLDVVGGSFTPHSGPTGGDAAKPKHQGGGIEASNSQVNITEVTFANLVAEEGGGLFVSGGSLTVRGCRFARTRAGSGGGAIAVQGAQLFVQDTRFEDTCARSKGGAILIEPNTATKASGGQPDSTLDLVSFVGTQADPDCLEGEVLVKGIHGIGGAVLLSGGTLAVARARFERSAASFGGGALHAAAAGSHLSVHVTGSSFEGPTAGEGGAVFQQGGILIMENGIRIHGSQARRKPDSAYVPQRSRGGAVCMLEGNTVLRHVEISDVESGGDGGSVFQHGGHLMIENVTVRRSEIEANEQVSSHGGAIFASQAKLKVVDLQVFGAKADYGGCIAIDKSGGMWANFTRMTLTKCKARKGDGGSMLISRLDRLDVQDAAMERGTSGGSGGCLRINKVMSADMRNLMVGSCIAGERGGGIDIHRSTVEFSNLTIDRARARLGGSLAVEWESGVRLVKAWLSDSTARGSGAAVHLSSGSSMKAYELVVVNAIAAKQGGGFHLYDSHLTIQDFEFQMLKAGINGQSIFAVNSIVQLAGGWWTSGPTENFWTFSKCVITCNDVQISMGLQGQFAAVDNTEMQFDNLDAQCALRSEFVNRTYSLACKPCQPHEGIVGYSDVQENHEECYACPRNSEGCRDRGCVCKSGYILNNTQPGIYTVLHDSVCVPCAKAMIDCPADEDVCGRAKSAEREPLALNCTAGFARECRQGWAVSGAWRMNNSLQAAVRCPYWPGCSFAGQCKEGYTGPMCMVCEAGRFRKGRFRACRPCNVHVVSNIIFFAGALLCSTLALIAGLYFKQVKYAVNNVRDAIEGHTSYIRVKLKQVTFIMQAFSTLQDLRYPAARVVNEVAATVTPIISLDIFASRHVAVCRLGLGGYSCYCLTLVQLVLIFTVILWIHKNCNVEVDWMVLTAYNFFLMGIVKESLGWFLCDSDAKAITGASYLLSDYSVVCSGFKYHLVLTVAGCVLVIWCIGIPGFLFSRMYQKRHQLNPQMEVAVGSMEGSLEMEVMSVFNQMSRDYIKATKFYGLATMLCVTQRTGLLDRNAVDTGNLTVSFCQEVDKKPSLEELMRIRSIAAGSTLMRLNNAELMKRGLRAIAERQSPSLKAYQNFYRQYKCGRWYYEFISIFGRIGFALVMVLPASLQCLAGLLLSGLLLLLVCWLMPFKRRSDNYVAAVCYLAMLGLFGAFTANVQKHTHVANYVSGICLACPLLSFLHYALRAYALPGRQQIWTAERADQLFDEEFARARLAPPGRRRQREVELAVLQSAGLLAAQPGEALGRDSADACG